MRISLFASQMVLKWRRLGEFALELGENASTIALNTENTFLVSFPTALDKNVKYAGGYRPKYQQYEDGTYPTPHYTLSSASWYRVFTMETCQFC